MRVRKAGRIVLLALCSSALLLVAGVGAGWAATPGVTDTEIRIGTTADLSGPIAHMGTGLTRGARLYFDYINEKGGIHGRTIRYIVEDDGYQSPRAVSNARKLVTRDRVFCMFMVLGSTGSNAMYPFLESQGVPLLFPGTQERTIVNPPRRYLFLSDTTYTTASTVGIEYFIEDMGKNPADMKIAVIYQDDMPGHDWLHGINLAAKHYGIDVMDLPYRRGSVDFSAQIARAKNWGATHVGIWGVIREVGLIMREAMRQEFKATYFTSYASMQKMVLELAGADALDYSKGLYGFGVVYDFESQNPAMLKYIERTKEAGLDYTNFNYLYGWQSATILVEALERAGRDLTREGIIEVLEGFEDFSPGINPPLTWGPGIRDGSKGVGIGIADSETMMWRSLLPEGEWRFSSIAD